MNFPLRSLIGGPQRSVFHMAGTGTVRDSGVSVAENLYAQGLIDAIVPTEKLAPTLNRLLTVLAAATDAHPGPAATVHTVDADEQCASPAWTSIKRTRRADRPGIRQMLARAATDVTELNGTGAGEPGHGMLVALARFGGLPCVIVAHDRDAHAHHPIDAAALRAARRGIRLATDLRLPLVTVIDTAGAALTRKAEEGGLAGEIARCIADLTTLPAPHLSVLLGQGCGGAALALLPADREPPNRVV